MSLEGIIGAIYPGEGKKPTSIYLKGDQSKQKYTCWDDKGKQKGDKIVYDIKALPDYNGKKQFQLDILDVTPESDVNADMHESVQDVVRNNTNTSIEAQVILKTVQLHLATHTEANFWEVVNDYTKAFKDIKGKLEGEKEEPEMYDGYPPTETTGPEPF